MTTASDRHSGARLLRREPGIHDPPPLVSSLQMMLKELYDARIEVAVKGCSIEARRVCAEARQLGGSLSRTRRVEREVAGWHDINGGLARQSIQDAHNAFRINASLFGSPFGSPDLQW